MRVLGELILEGVLSLSLILSFSFLFPWFCHFLCLLLALWFFLFLEDLLELFFHFWSSKYASWGSWIWNSNFVFFVVNVLIKGEIEKPSGQYLDSMCDESLICHGLNSNPERFWWFYLYLCLCGELHLLVSCCTGGRCGMTGSNEDHGRSRRPGAEDQGWSRTSQVLGVRTIEMLDDVVCGLHHAHGDKERVFLSLALKSRSMICQWFGIKTIAAVCQWIGLKPTMTVCRWFDLKTTGTVWQ
jgi:hypothetical protein